LILLFLFTVGLPEALAETLVVDHGGGRFETIREAVLSANAGDEILISPGYYREGEISILRPVSIIGTGGQAIVESGGEAAFRVKASGCVISGLAIRGTGEGVGVELNSPGNSVEGCKISNFSTGALSASSENRIVESTIEGCSVGVRVWNGLDNFIVDTRIRSSLGVEIAGSRISEISNCTFSGEIGVEISNSSENAVVGSVFLTATGIVISDSDRNRIEGNEISSSERGIALDGSMENEILENEISGSRVVGVILLDSEKNAITNNSARDCTVGIRLKDSIENQIGYNLLEENEVSGIRLEGSTNNKISGNLLRDNGEGLLFKSGSSENAIEYNEIIRNVHGLSLIGSGRNALRGNLMELNRYSIRVDREDPSAWDDLPFRQDVDSSNTVDGRPVCYIVDGRDLKLEDDCGFLALVGCKNVTAENLVIFNNSYGALIVNSTSCAAKNLTLFGNEAGIRMLKTADCEVATAFLAASPEDLRSPALRSRARRARS
jgi:parallel beta-helix repeat protein